jgi:predicted membrane metal-binding protein
VNRPSPKSPRQPLFWAAVVFSFGLWFGSSEWRPPLWWVTAFVVFLLASCWYVKQRVWLAKLLALAMCFLAGAFSIQLRSSSATRQDRSAAPSLTDGGTVTLVGHVTREGYAREAYPGVMQESVDIETESASESAESWPVSVGVRLAIREKVGDAEQNSNPKDALNNNPATANSSPISSTGLSYGMRLRVRAKLHTPRNYRDPGAFDYEGYLLDNGINLLGSADATDIELLPGFSGNRIEWLRTRIHASIIRKIHELWPPEQASLMDAMVLGEESFFRNAPRKE